MTPYLFAAVAAGIVAGIASAALPWFVALPMGLCVAQVVDGLIRARNSATPFKLGLALGKGLLLSAAAVAGILVARYVMR